MPGGLDVPSLSPMVRSPRQGGQLLEDSSPTKVVTGAQYDHELFEDDVEEEDLSYYCSSTQGKRGRKLSEGGPPKPDTTNMGEKEESRLMCSSYFLDYVIRNEVFCVGEVIVEVFL